MKFLIIFALLVICTAGVYSQITGALIRQLKNKEEGAQKEFSKLLDAPGPNTAKTIFESFDTVLGYSVLDGMMLISHIMNTGLYKVDFDTPEEAWRTVLDTAVENNVISNAMAEQYKTTIFSKLKSV